ncbi:MAG: hypothetical protein EXQ54_03755 [Acidobacteria bacterium]|nr:hypothetical protein [Acidobacteriota bacterium]
MRWPLKAMSELAKSSAPGPCGGRGAAGAAGVAGVAGAAGAVAGVGAGAPAGRSPGIASPAGFFGS